MKNIYLFDLDGTLTESAQIISDCMIIQLKKIKERGHEIGIVGGGHPVPLNPLQA
jgi:hydroxymethylpyrimidine pyrophosphatase-like HAD family hydrolase